MRIKVLFILQFISAIVFKAQSPDILHQYENYTLFNLSDSSCSNINGTWTGEEIQYDATKSYVKYKFKVVFTLQQEGNRISGTSFIQDKFRGSYGDMKIRGIVNGNKFLFEEYEITNEQFFDKNLVWCLRSGEMNIQKELNKTQLVGINYNGFESDTYRNCTDYAEMVAEKNDQRDEQNSSNFRINLVQSKYNIPLRVSPNPCTDNATVTFDLKDDGDTEINLYSLSGALIQNITAVKYTSGRHQLSINLGNVAPGVYVLMLKSGRYYGSAQLVKSK
ncbi:MAG: T9SS type A sorting domain-containing protein [Bacteroidia bacterium]|nr:T9SS type A sorting domain-containing protein [Bacteroidia bacterium]